MLLAEFCIIVFGRQQSIFVMVNKVINGFGSPLLAVIILGMIPRRPGADSVFLGGLTGALFSIVTGCLLEHLALHYYAVVNLLFTFTVCYALEFFKG